LRRSRIQAEIEADRVVTEAALRRSRIEAELVSSRLAAEDQESKLILQLKAPSEDQELRPKSKLQESEDYIIPTFDLFGYFI